MDGSSDILPLGGKVINGVAEREVPPETPQKEDQVMHEPSNMKASSEIHQIVSKVMYETPKTEVSSENFQDEGQAMHDPARMDAFLETAHEVQETHETPKLEPLSKCFHREGQVMHEPPKAEASSESFNQESQVHYKMQFDVTQETKRQKLECYPLETKSVVSEKISLDANLCTSRFEASPGERTAISFQHLETEKNCVIENGERVAKQVKEMQENKQTNFSHNHPNCKEQSNNVNTENTPDKEFCNRIQEKQKQEQQPKKQKGGHVGENYERINYLVQASRALVNMGEYNSELGSVDFDQTLASQTGSMASAVGRRCLIRLTPSLKRMLCKGCGTVLIHGVNSRVRHRSKRQKHLVITCLTCNTIKRFVVNPEHKLWCDQEESLV